MSTAYPALPALGSPVDLDLVPQVQVGSRLVEQQQRACQARARAIKASCRSPPLISVYSRGARWPIPLCPGPESHLVVCARGHSQRAHIGCTPHKHHLGHGKWQARIAAAGHKKRRASSLAASVRTSWPAMVMRPPCTRCAPRIHRSKVVLPAPFGPSRQRMSPAPPVKDTSCKSRARPG